MSFARFDVASAGRKEGDEAEVRVKAEDEAEVRVKAEDGLRLGGGT